MDKERIENVVRSYISQANNNLSIENNKFDFKRKWYDLKSGPGISEFLKDTTAIVNTVGLEGLIVIGFDDKKNEFFDSKFSDSNLRDPNELGGIINKNVDRLFNIDTFDIELDGNFLSIIHIPTSFDKPHVIRGYRKFKKGEEVGIDQHRIFVRKSSGASLATKYDIDFMYFDRKNTIPEFDVHLFFRSLDFTLELSQNTVNMNLYLSVENTGRRTIAINNFEVIIEHTDIKYNNLKFGHAIKISDEGRNNRIRTEPCIIKREEIMWSCYL